MSRLPQPGSDDSTWGNILNDFLSVSHNSDGTVKTSVLATKADNVHTHTSADVVGLGETIEDTIGAKVVAGANIAVAYNDTTGNTTVSAKSSLYFNVMDYGAAGNGTTDDTIAVQAAIDAAAAKTTGGVAYFPAGRYLIGKVVWKSKVSLLGDGIQRTFLKQKNANNDDLIITESFASEANTNYNGYTLMNAVFIKGFTIEGNNQNQTIQAVQSEKRNYHYLIKFYGWKPLFEDLELRAGEGALYTEYSNNQPHDPFEMYEVSDATFRNIKALNYARAGWTFRGPHDSNISNIRLFGGDYDTPDYDFLADNNGNYGGQGSYVYDLHLRSSPAAGGYNAILKVGLTGEMYVEGSKESCVLIQTSSSNLRILTGYQDVANDTANDAAVVVKAESGQNVSHNNLEVIAYYGPVNGDLVRVENNSGTVNSNNIRVHANEDAAVSGSLIRLIGALFSGTFVSTGGGCTQAMFNTDSYSGGNNHFEARAWNKDFFTTTSTVGKSDKKILISDNWPDATRKTTYTVPVGDRSFGLISTGSDVYVDADSMQVRNVTDPTSAQHAATKNYVDTRRPTKRTATATSSATPTINTNNVEFYSLTAQAVDITSFSINLSGTPTEAQTLWIAITGTAARAITWGSSFEASTVALPTTTVGTNRLDVGFIWNSATSKWRCVASC